METYLTAASSSGGDVPCKRFVEFRRILAADEARQRCERGDSSVETVFFFVIQEEHSETRCHNLAGLGLLFQSASEKCFPRRQPRI